MSTDFDSLEWPPGPLSPKLRADEVHLWRASLDCGSSVLSRLEATLSPDEIARADRFVFETDRSHFVMGRGILRELLGSYLMLSPAALQFSYGIHGKPALELESGGSSLQFNLSHSGGLAVYAFSYGRKLGIDVSVFDPSSQVKTSRKGLYSARIGGAANASATIPRARIFPLLDAKGSLREGTWNRPQRSAGQLCGISHAGPPGRTAERGQRSLVNALVRTLYRICCRHRRGRKRLATTLLELVISVADFQVGANVIERSVSKRLHGAPASVTDLCMSGSRCNPETVAPIAIG